jgi:hypothetical protein
MKANLIRAFDQDGRTNIPVFLSWVLEGRSHGSEEPDGIEFGRCTRAPALQPTRRGRGCVGLRKKG